MEFQTLHHFTLPKGLLDDTGVLHREGTMRLATAGDELAAMRDPKAKTDSAVLPLLVLARVISHIGAIQSPTFEQLEKLYTQDYQFLQNMYQCINESEDMRIHVTCPHCGKQFDDTVNFTIPE